MRAVNRVVATVVALVLLVVSVVAVVEIVLAALGRQPWVVQHSTLAQDLHQRTWADGWVRTVAVVVAVVGLLLLWVSLKRSTPSDIELDSPAQGVRLAVDRRSVERYLSGVAAGQTGVDDAAASVNRDRVTVRAVTALRDPGDLKKRVWEAVSTRGAALEPAGGMKTTVLLRRRDT